MRLLLDANVLISAAIRPSGPPGVIVSLVIEGNGHTLVLSPSIVAEVEKALLLPRVRKYLASPKMAALWIADLAALADLVNDTNHAKGACRDPDDDAVLSAAIEGRAEVIVTGDEDLLVLSNYEGIRIVSPRAFLGRI